MKEEENLDIQWSGIAESLRQHLQDVSAALVVIDRIRAWFAPQAVAGISTLSSYGGTVAPTSPRVGKTVIASAYALLSHARRPMQISEMVEALMISGVTTHSTDFSNCLNTLLSRRKDMFERVSPKTWGLIEWQTSPDCRAQGRPQEALVTPFRPAGQP